MPAARKVKAAEVVRRAPGPKTYPVGDWETDYEPLRFNTVEDETEEERVILFYLDEVAYDIPKHFPPGLGLRVIRTSRRQGDAVAAAELLEEVIGEEAYVALMNHKGLSQEDIKDLMFAVQKVALGALDVPKGSSRSA